MRGQAIVEFALIAPLFFIIIFGIIEFALINASIGTVNFAAKDAARTAAIIGRGQAPDGSGNDLDTYIVNNVIRPRVSGVVAAKLTSVEFYRAAESGGCLNGTLPTCAQYDMWQKVGGTWTSTSQGSYSNTACAYDPTAYPPGQAPPSVSYWPAACRLDDLADADYVGVSITYTYTYITAFFATSSPTLTLTSLSVQRVEPQQFGWHSSPSRTAVAFLGSETGAIFGSAHQALDSALVALLESSPLREVWRGDASQRRRL